MCESGSPQAGEVKTLHFSRLREKVDRAKRETDEGLRLKP